MSFSLPKVVNYSHKNVININVHYIFIIVNAKYRAFPFFKLRPCPWRYQFLGIVLVLPRVRYGFTEAQSFCDFHNVVMTFLATSVVISVSICLYCWHTCNWVIDRSSWAVPSLDPLSPLSPIGAENVPPLPKAKKGRLLSPTDNYWEPFCD